MRRLLLAVSLFGLWLPIQAQNNGLLLPVNQVSFNVFSYKNREVVDGGPGYYPYLFSGASYKRMINDHILRFNFNYFQKFDEHLNPEISSTGNYKEIELGFGYQRTFFEYWVKPYLAADIVILNSSATRENESVLGNSYEKSDMRVFGMGFSPIFGLRFETNTALSLSVEMNLQFIMTWERGSVFYWEPDIVPEYTDVNNSEFITRWNPVSGLFLTLDF